MKSRVPISPSRHINEEKIGFRGAEAERMKDRNGLPHGTRDLVVHGLEEGERHLEIP